MEDTKFLLWLLTLTFSYVFAQAILDGNWLWLFASLIAMSFIIAKAEEIDMIEDGMMEDDDE